MNEDFDSIRATDFALGKLASSWLGFADVPVFLRPGTRAGRSQRLALSPSRVFRHGRRGAHHSRIDSGESGGAHFASGYGLVERRASSRLAADHALCARA